MERVPSWVGEHESGIIVIGILRYNAPADERAENEREKLRSLLAIDEIRDAITPSENALMMAAVYSSRSKRLQIKDQQGTAFTFC